MTDSSKERLELPGLTRRRMLQGLGLAGLGALAGPALLAACGDDDSDGGSASETTKSGESGTTGGGTTGVGELASLLKIDPASAGAGQTLEVAGVLALTGSGSFYGKTMSRGMDLAAKHIKDAGGPEIKITYWDHKSGDAQAGKDAGTEIGAKKIPVCLPSYAAVLGAMLPAIEQYKVFCLDGGGGTGIFAQGKPYFWGTRAITPNDTFAGLFKYIKETSPDAKTVGLAGWDIGEPGNSITKEDILKQIAANGYTHNGLYELVPIGNLDYSALLTKIKANEPDVLFLGMYGQDPGAFVNQKLTAGLKAKIFGFEFTPDGVNASKGSYDSEGWTFAYDYFDPEASTNNPLAKFFVSEFEKEYDEKPDFYAANFYENMMRVWLMASRVLKSGGSIQDGAALDKALQSDLKVPSIYGGTETEVGYDELDPVSHSVKRRVMGVFEYKAKKVKQLAFFNIGGADYRKV